MCIHKYITDKEIHYISTSYIKSLLKISSIECVISPNQNISLRDKQFAEAGHMASVNAAHSHSEGKPCTYFYIQYFYFYLLVSDVA